MIQSKYVKSIICLNLIQFWYSPKWRSSIVSWLHYSILYCRYYRTCSSFIAIITIRFLVLYRLSWYQTLFWPKKQIALVVLNPRNIIINNTTVERISTILQHLKWSEILWNAQFVLYFDLCMVALHNPRATTHNPRATMQD